LPYREYPLLTHERCGFSHPAFIIELFRSSRLLFDTVRIPEKVYQAFVLGKLIWLSGSYEIRTNRESGYGHYDMLFKPKNSEKLGIVIEYKQVYED
jgi:hypothetical protein